MLERGLQIKLKMVLYYEMSTPNEYSRGNRHAARN